MKSTYLLNCPCGERLPVQAAQAGETVHCSCGATLAVPALRELSTLPPLTSKAKPRPAKRRSTWSGRERGVLIGALITAAALGWYGYLRLTTPRIAATTDALVPLQVWLEWQDLRQGADRRLNVIEQQFLEQLEVNHFFQNVTLALCAAGILLMAGSYAIPKRRGRPAEVDSP